MSFSGWREVKLGDVCTYASAKVSVSEVSEDNYISTENMLPNKSGVTKSSGLPTVGSVTKYSAGNVLVSNIRPYFRKIWYADREGGCSNDVLVFDINDSKTLDSKFLFYCLSNDAFFDYVMAGSKGTKMPRGDKGAIMKYPVPLPPLPEQKAIAATLSALDDMIELNNKINKTLEEMAQAIFKSWFVDFEPFKDGEFEESELGLIPKGWRVVELRDISKDIICGKTPPTKDKENYGNVMPFITIPDMHGNVFTTKTERYLSRKGIDTQQNKTLPKFSVCVSCIATPGLVTITSEKSQTNQQINSIICKDNISCFYVYLFMDSISDIIKTLGSGGSATLNLNKSQFSKIKIIECDDRTMKEFHNLVEPLFLNILDNQIENLVLSSIRDTLLPKLMSGEIRVPVEEVV